MISQWLGWLRKAILSSYRGTATPEREHYHRDTKNDDVPECRAYGGVADGERSDNEPDAEYQIGPAGPGGVRVSRGTYQREDNNGRANDDITPQRARDVRVAEDERGDDKPDARDNVQHTGKSCVFHTFSPPLVLK